MKLYLKIFEFFLNSSIWVAITVSALVEITCVDIGVKTSVFLRFFIFLGTIFGYNFIKYFEKTHLSVFHPMVLKVNFTNISEKFKELQLQEKATFLLSVFSAISCCVFSFKLNYETLVLLCIPALLSFFYAVSYRNKTLRSTSGLKIYVVGVVWAIVTVILPVVDAKIDVDYDEIGHTEILDCGGHHLYANFIAVCFWINKPTLVLDHNYCNCSYCL